MPKVPNPAHTHTPEVLVNTDEAARKDDPGSTAKLPHERDQSIDMTGGAKSPEITQAFKDLERGLRDTDARAPDGRPEQLPTEKRNELDAED